MTNIEKIIENGEIGLFKELQKGNNVTFCNRFGIPMRADTSYDLEKWMLEEAKDDIDIEIEKFIEAFANYGYDAVKCFRDDCSYWFAFILFKRFETLAEKPVIEYSQASNHFVTKINGKLYDITGDVTNIFNQPHQQTTTWNYFQLSEPALAEKIVASYINKTKRPEK